MSKYHSVIYYFYEYTKYRQQAIPAHLMLTVKKIQNSLPPGRQTDINLSYMTFFKFF